jgi:FtsP/CotA-like multicopper oxidase with cupredoxin domain
VSRARGARFGLAALSLVAMFVVAGCGSSATKPPVNAKVSTDGGSTTVSDAATSSTSSIPPAGAMAEIAVEGGKVAGGVKRIQVDVGKTVTLGVTSDADEELHVHGYDLKRDLTPGARVEVVFTADIPGVFDVELEHSGLKVAELQVG